MKSKFGSDETFDQYDSRPGPTSVVPSQLTWLALMRPLTLAGIFAAVANLFVGLANTFIGLSRVPATEPVGQRIAVMLAETSVVPFISFVFLSTAWLCVAIGMRRQM